ncbi:putative phytosulfokines 6 [Nicotiana tabacum]|uniref:Phytosulfokine n=1 Tax=Nicotiana tabacum TaxID=4097 RepID=A0A1S3YXV8_TOBAC|nr:putative phytosulfokines 6 [Nicotiana tomentosiformis]XP_016456948.1 PREDICTED: putative phytosulfokines 6 [Nicotiana tabacum]
MKQNLYFLLLLLLLVSMLVSSQASARFLANNQVKGEVKLHKTIGGDSIDRMETTDDSNELRGVEECDDGDEECFKRRVIAEAHLDYIYTQHHDHP